MASYITARVTGQVQGVGFRAWTQAEARALALSGWVRNEADGSVRAVIAGEDAAVARMLERLRTGPAGARVDAVETADAEPPDEGFSIRR